MLEPQEQIQEGLRYQKLGMFEEALEQYRRVIDFATDPGVVSEALCRESLVHRSACRWDAAIAAARRSASIALVARLDDHYAEALNAEGIVHQERGDFDAAVALYEIIVRMHVDPRICGLAFQNLGAIAAQRAHLDAARRLFLESQRYFVRADYRWGEALAMNNRAAIALDQGRYKEAEVIAGQTIVAAKKIGDLELLGIALLNQAEALAGQRRLEEAHAPALEAMRYFDLEENNLRRAQCFRILADFKIMQGDTAAARELYERALELAVSVGSEWEASRVRDAMELASAAA